ncbi:MAG TPA: hypothetical protein VMS63_06970, partial [Gaiellaceae bacterium]|nr:hypothetical protein [Gaiellaceae bacterium]
SQIKSHVIILGGNDFETNGDTVIYENESGAADGTASQPAQLVQRTTPRMVENGELADGTPTFAPDTNPDTGLPVTDTFLSLESTGLGISPTGTMSVEQTPYFGLQMQGIEHLQLRLSNAGSNLAIEDNWNCVGTTTTNQMCTPDAGTLPAPTVDVVGGTGNDTFVVMGIGAATSILGGGGTDTTTVQAPSGDLSAILGRLTVDGDDLVATQTTHVMPTGDDPYQALVSQFLTQSILVIPTGSSKGTDSAGHPYYEAAWVPILCVDTATATSTYCNDTGSGSLVGSVEVRSAVIGSTGNLVTVDVQQKGSQLYAQQKYGYQATDTESISFYTFDSIGFGFFSFVRHTVSFSVPLFLNPDGSTTFDDTGVPDIVEANYGSSGAVALYLDAAGHETTDNTGLPALVLPGASYAHTPGPSVPIYVNPSFQYVTTPWGPNLLSDGDFSQSVPSNGAANGWTSTNIDGNGGWRPDYFILNSNGSASTDPTISQSLTVSPGVQYQISLYVTNVYPQYGGSSPNPFEVAVNGQVVTTRLKAQANGWLLVTTYWTAGAGTTTATLSLIGEHGDDSSFAVTDVSLQAQNTPAYVTDWTGTDLCIDGSGREVACPSGATGGLRPSTVPVYATVLTPFVRTADITASSLGGVALAGHDSLDIEATSTSSATTTVESFTVPVDQLSAGQPVMYTVNSGGLRAAVPGTAQTYFGGEPVVDPLTGAQLYYSGGEPVLDVFTGQPVKDPNGTTLTHPTCTDTLHHVGCDPMLHIAGDPVVEARGSVVDFLGGEQVFDENGNPVYTGSQPFTYQPGTAEIVNRGQTVHELEQSDGSLVAIDATSFSAPSFTLTTLAGAILTLTGGVTIATGDLVSVLVYDGTDIYTLPSTAYTTSAGSVTLGAGLHTHCTTTGCVTVKLVIQRPALHGTNDAKLYNGSEPVVAGQPILDAGNNLQYDASGNVLVYTGSQTTQTVHEAFYWIPSGGQQTITLNQPAGQISNLTIVIGTTTLAAADYTLTGSTLVLHPQESALLGPLTGPNSVVGESITIAYTG